MIISFYFKNKKVSYYEITHNKKKIVVSSKTGYNLRELKKLIKNISDDQKLPHRDERFEVSYGN